MIDLPPIPNDAINEATAEIFAITNSLTLAARVGHDALNAALPYIVIATLRWAAELLEADRLYDRHSDEWAPLTMNIKADEIEAELNK
jgi:hypothetical protein